MITSFTKNNQKKKQLLPVVFFVLIVCLLAGKLFFPAGKSFFLFGHSMYSVSSASMEPEYPVHSLVFIKNEPFETLKTGDVIAFRSDSLSGATALHRIVRKTEDGIFTKGDANNYEDGQPVTVQNYIGKCVFKITFFARYLALVRKPLGFFMFFLMPAAALILANFAFRYLKSGAE